jgi:predicted dehydrogenase/glycosyltransferase involved in cell wall biosynthesis
MPGVEVAAVVDVLPGVAEQVAHRFGVGAWFTDHRQMLGQVKPQVVHVVTPPPTHFRLAMDALEAGAHVFVEKPVTVRYADLVELRHTAETCHRVLLEDHNYLFNRPVQRVLQLIESGHFGDVTHVEAMISVDILAPGSPFVAPRPGNPWVSLPGGAITDFLPHLAYLAQAFVGPYRAVRTSWTKRDLASPLPSDEFRALVEAQKGTAELCFSAHTRPDVFWLRVYGTKMRATVNLFESRLTIDRLRPGPRALTPLLNGMGEALGVTRSAVSGVWRKVRKGPGPYEGLGELLRRAYSAWADETAAPISLDQIDQANRLVAELLSDANRMSPAVRGPASPMLPMPSPSEPASVPTPVPGGITSNPSEEPAPRYDVESEITLRSERKDNGMRIAYLTNVYPRGNHTFIRREIAGIEAEGFTVDRYSIQYSTEKLVDAWNISERNRTRHILSVGAKGLALASLKVLLTSPIRYFKALRLAAKIGWRSERGLARNLIYHAEACVFLQWMRQTGAQHMHAHFGTNSASVAMLTHALGGPPFSFTNHGPDEFDKPEFLGMSEKIARCAFTVAISHYGRSQLARWCPHEQWSKLQVVRCGVDRSFLDAPLDPVPHSKRFVSIGRYCEAKGFLLLIEAARELAAEGWDFEVLIIGDGDLRPEFERRIKNWGLEKHVKLTPGWISSPDVLKEIKASRGLAMASFGEGLPVAIMETLALGRPVISTYIAGIPELIEPGINGWLVPAGSAEALADAMRESLQTPLAQLTEMGRAGARAVARKHNSLVEASKLAKFFRASIAASANPGREEQVPDQSAVRVPVLVEA